MRPEPGAVGQNLGTYTIETNSQQWKLAAVWITYACLKAVHLLLLHLGHDSLDALAVVAGARILIQLFCNGSFLGRIKRSRPIQFNYQ